MIRTTLDCVRLVSLDTWCVERCVCGWSSWLTTSLSTVVSCHILFSAHACFGLPLPCLLSVLSVSRIFFSKLLYPLLFHFISANSTSSLLEQYSLYWCKFLINALLSSLNGMLRYWCFVTVKKIILYENCLQTLKVYLKLNVI